MLNNEITLSELENSSNFYNEYRTKLNTRIEKNQTIVFLNRNEAYKYSRKVKSYLYELFIERKISKSQYGKATLYGYAVPK